MGNKYTLVFQQNDNALGGLARVGGLGMLELRKCISVLRLSSGSHAFRSAGVLQAASVRVVHVRVPLEVVLHGHSRGGRAGPVRLDFVKPALQPTSRNLVELHRC
jgi:hypothetical protein